MLVPSARNDTGMMKKLSILILIVLLSIAVSPLVGCGRKTEVTKEITVVEEVRAAPASEQGTEPPRTVKTTTTSETTSEKSGGCGGLLSCTVDVAGAIIALPFKIVGALIDVIF
jgi:hypothetical protein